MKRSKRLKPVQNLAEQRRKSAEQQLGLAQQQLSAERDKLVQLQTYLDDYQQDLLTTGRAGVTMEQLQRLQVFKQRLLDAVTQQQRQISFSEQLLEQAKLVWQTARGREQAMGSLISRTQEQERQQEEKGLQKQIDEMTQNRRGRGLL
ncbi:MAG: flagellar export protein FliJ [Motiliproteus sp.]